MLVPSAAIVKSNLQLWVDIKDFQRCFLSSFFFLTTARNSLDRMIRLRHWFAFYNLDTKITAVWVLAQEHSVIGNRSSFHFSIDFSQLFTADYRTKLLFLFQDYISLVRFQP